MTANVDGVLFSISDLNWCHCGILDGRNHDVGESPLTFMLNLSASVVSSCPPREGSHC